MDDDAIEYLCEKMLCSEKLARELVKERKLFPYPVALKHIAKTAGQSVSDIEADFISAIRSDNIKIFQASDNPETVSLGDDPIADWHPPAVQPIDFSKLAVSNDFDDRERLSEELARPAYNITAGNCTVSLMRMARYDQNQDPSGRENPFHESNRTGSAKEQSIFLFDPIALRKWAQSEYDQTEKNAKTGVRKTGGDTEDWPWFEFIALAIAIAFCRGSMPTKQVDAVDLLIEAFQSRGYQETDNKRDPSRIPGLTRLKENANKLLAILDESEQAERPSKKIIGR